MSDFVAAKSLVDALDNFANGDFNTPYSAAVASSGFSPVVSYINATNKNSTSGSMSTNVTPAVAIQYILVNDGTGISVVKNNLRILEIEPTTNFLYSENMASKSTVILMIIVSLRKTEMILYPII